MTSDCILRTRSVGKKCIGGSAHGFRVLFCTDVGRATFRARFERSAASRVGGRAREDGTTGPNNDESTLPGITPLLITVVL